MFDEARVGQKVTHEGRVATLIGFRCGRQGLVGDTEGGCATTAGACRLRYEDTGRAYNVMYHDVDWAPKMGSDTVIVSPEAEAAEATNVQSLASDVERKANAAEFDAPSPPTAPDAATLLEILEARSTYLLHRA